MPNKAFKSDSQRLAVSLRSSIAKRRSHLNAALALYEDTMDLPNQIKQHKAESDSYAILLYHLRDVGIFP